MTETATRANSSRSWHQITLHLATVVGMALCGLAAFGSAAFAQDRSFPIKPGQVIERDIRYVSESGGHYMIFQPDNNLVVYQMNDQFVWGLNEQPGVDYRRAARVQMNHDGNLGISDAQDRHVWSAINTEKPDSSAQLVLSETGALQLVSQARGTFWASDGKLALASPAEGDFNFQSPDGNVHCFASTEDVRCDIIETIVLSFSQQPSDCNLDWGRAFLLEQGVRGRPLCAGDTIVDSNAPVLEYGNSQSVGEYIVCFSERTGMLCNNRRGSGIFLSRKEQSIY